MKDPFELLVGDALEKMRPMPSGSVQAVITDPPYCSGGFSETQKKQAAGQGLMSETIKEIGWFVNDNMSTAGLIWLLRTVAVEAERILEDGGSMLMFTDWRMVPHLAPALESSGMQYRNMIVWNKGAPGLGNGFRPQHEIILHFVKGSGNYYDLTVGNVINCGRMSHLQRLHQTQKPVEVMAKLVKVVTKEGDTVLDPFAGSGSTGEACLKLGRNFIGIEKSGRYHQVATQRLTTVTELNLFS